VGLRGEAVGEVLELGDAVGEADGELVVQELGREQELLDWRSGVWGLGVGREERKKEEVMRAARATRTTDESSTTIEKNLSFSSASSLKRPFFCPHGTTNN
jgi:hypothetical protein